MTETDSIRQEYEDNRIDPQAKYLKFRSLWDENNGKMAEEEFDIGYALTDMTDAANYALPIVVKSLQNQITAITLLNLLKERLNFDLQLLRKHSKNGQLAYVIQDRLAQILQYQILMQPNSELEKIKDILLKSFCDLKAIQDSTNLDEDLASDLSQIAETYSFWHVQQRI